MRELWWLGGYGGSHDTVLTCPCLVVTKQRGVRTTWGWFSSLELLTNNRLLTDSCGPFVWATSVFLWSHEDLQLESSAPKLNSTDVHQHTVQVHCTCQFSSPTLLGCMSYYWRRNQLSWYLTRRFVTSTGFCYNWRLRTRSEYFQALVRTLLGEYLKSKHVQVLCLIRVISMGYVIALEMWELSVALIVSKSELAILEFCFL